MSFMLLTASDVTVLAPTGTCLLRGQVPVVLTAGRQSARPARLARGTPPRTSQTSAPAEYPDVLRLLHPMQYGPFGLPHVPVERPFGYITEDLHLGVEISLAENTAFTLGDVGRPPRAVKVVQGNGSGLDVGADAHLLGRAHEHGDAPGPAGGEQLAFVAVGLCLVDEADALAG